MHILSISCCSVPGHASVRGIWFTNVNIQRLSESHHIARESINCTLIQISEVNR